MAEMPMPEGQEAPEQGGMNPSDLIMGVSDGLNKLTVMMEKAPGVDPAAKKAMADALMAFEMGVQTLLGKGASQAVPAPGMSSMEAGNAKVTPAM